MDATHAAALAALGERRFASFADAAETTLGGLSAAVPGTLTLARLDPDGETCRITDVHGDRVPGLDRGATLRVSTPGVWLDGEFLASAGIASSLVSALELHDGNIAGLVCALDRRREAYAESHRLLVRVAARILAYEWGAVRAQAELRQLRDEGRDRASTDAETGMLNHDAFLDKLEREWKLAKRGTVQSFLVACRVVVDGSPDSSDSPITALALRDAAEVLAGIGRSTDHFGRVGPESLAAVLVGCNGGEGAEAFLTRFHEALERATRGRRFSIELVASHRDITLFDSAVEALAETAQSATFAVASEPAAPAMPGQAGA